MAASMAVTGDTPIAIKISVGDAAKKIRLPLKDLTAEVLPAKLITVLGLPTDKKVTFERFSDSAGSFVQLDPNNPAVYKTLVRAAKAKLKLRLKATVEGQESSTAPAEAHEIPVMKYEPVAKRTNIGAGIFDFKDNHASSAFNEAPVPFMFKVMDESLASVRASMANKSSPTTSSQAQPVRVKDLASQTSTPIPVTQVAHSVCVRPTWSVYCNECNVEMTSEHYHCGTCDGGDYDLCHSCVKSGKLCPGAGHWLVKRTFKDGQVVSSTTERFHHKPAAAKPNSSPPQDEAAARSQASAIRVQQAVNRLRFGPPIPKTIPQYYPPHAHKHWLNSQPKDSKLPYRGVSPPANPPVTMGMPGAFMDETKGAREDLADPTRTCNSCISILPERLFVHCTDCEDFDLCLKCHAAKKHGHHPGHTFSPAVKGQSLPPAQIQALAPGNGLLHFALCDGCDKNIVGVRHKCFQCPDFDYCSECFADASTEHPGHRFATLYDAIPSVSSSAPVVHMGIYCDGPACSSRSGQTYIEGARYKCVVCHDTDFCANCEASPLNRHNRTHPLIKISTPVSGLHVSTVNKEGSGCVRRNLGDDAGLPPVQLDQPLHSKPVSTASSVKTVAHIAPSSVDTEEKLEKPVETPSDDLHAHFVSDTIPDGININQGTRFTQVWNMVNPGPATWPAGCSVRYVGGDNMLNLDDRPVDATAMTAATESNVIGREVLPGEQVAFKVVMKAPSRGGKAISYWRVKSPSGIPFGHRLWCDINVRIPQEAAATADKGDASTKDHLSLAMNANGYIERDRQLQACRRALREQMIKTLNMANEPDQSVDACWARFKQGLPPHVANNLQDVMYPAGPTPAKDHATSGNEAKPTADIARDAATTLSTTPTVTAESTVPARKDSESPMVFPTLDKESPASSTYLSTSSRGESKAKAASVEDEQTGVVTTAEKPAVAAAAEEEEVFQDIASEIEVLSASSSFSDDDDGFLTDEEYDILDASDQETLA